MARLIDAEALKEKMTVSALGGHKRIWVCGVIDDAPTVEPQSAWIPCSERMPEDDERVLGNITITVNANMMKPKQRTIFARHDRVLGWTTANGYPIVGKITHWMPLPEPPKEDEE